MKNRRIKAIAASCILLAGALSGCGGSPPIPAGNDSPRATERELRGRDFVRMGEFIEITGTLKPERGEWFLIAGDGVYEIHLGDHSHRASTGITLEEGKKASVRGYVYKREGAGETDIAVCSVLIDGKEYRFREDDGTPLWKGQSAGRGHGTPEAEKQGGGPGEGHRR